MNLATFLLALCKPLVGRVLVALGMSVVTITGLAFAMDTLKGLVLSNFGAMPAAGLQISLLAGAGEALGFIFGAITLRLTLWQIQQSTKILGVNS